MVVAAPEEFVSFARPTTTWTDDRLVGANDGRLAGAAPDGIQHSLKLQRARGIL